MQQPPKVSVLVPIFRVEQYLRQCVDSIINQTLTDIEIILIDDGSDDTCPQICDEYASRDPRVKVIHKRNSGYGASMNQGLGLATGEYIGIVESDDWASPDMFAELYQLATTHGVDVVRSNYWEYTTTEEETLVHILPHDCCNHVVNPRKEVNLFYSPPAIWTCIYKRSFLEAANIRFLESPGASYQDVGFNFKVWAMAESVWVTPQAYYHYRCDNATASVKSPGKVFCVADEWREIERYLEQYPEKKRASLILRNHLKYSNYIWNFHRLAGEEQAAFHKLFSREYRHILKNDGLCRDSFSAAAWKELLKIVYASSLERRLRTLGHKIARLFVKQKVRNGKRRYSVLGLVRFDKNIAYPEWKEGNSPNT